MRHCLVSFETLFPPTSTHAHTVLVYLHVAIQPTLPLSRHGTLSSLSVFQSHFRLGCTFSSAFSSFFCGGAAAAVQNLISKRQLPLKGSVPQSHSYSRFHSSRTSYSLLLSSVWPTREIKRKKKRLIDLGNETKWDYSHTCL